MLEVCVDSPSGLLAAVAGGADRIELCSALQLGGLTPGPGLVALAAAVPVPVRAMIRPRGGDFVYGEPDRDVMRREIDAMRAAGVSGVVIGATTRDGALDVALLEMLVGHATGLAVTLHRAVDLLPDPVVAVEVAVGLGIATILTSGGAKTAIDGADTIRAMHERAAGRVEILAGGGVRPDNVMALRQKTGIGSFHASCAAPAPEADEAAIRLGFATGQERVTDAGIVARLRVAANEGLVG